jgi:hypothetical protein
MSTRALAVFLLPCFASLILQAADPKLPPGAANGASDSHLVGWWKFDETSGLTAADSSVGKHAAALQGGLSFERDSVPGQLGRAVRLDGKEARICVPGFKGVTGSGTRTIAAWVKTSTAAGEIVSWGQDEHGAMWIFGFIRSGLGVTPKGGYLYMKDNVQDNAWHHVAVVVNEGSPPNLHDHVQLYRDGTPAVIDDIGLLDLWPIETGNQLDVVIGQRFNGALDDLRIYDRALSENEITALARTDSGSESGSRKE